MNQNDIENWREDVGNHIKTIEMLINDRKTLKNLMIEHLKSYFEWDKIEFNNDFSVITLIWRYDNLPVIDPNIIQGLGMEFRIDSSLDEELGTVVAIEICPWGVDNSP